jgi:hypothetical protein
MEASESIDRAGLRQRAAQEVLDWCRRAIDGGKLRTQRGDRERRTAAALQLHDLHARHAREQGDDATAAKAEERYDHALQRHVRKRPGMSP